MSEDKKNNTAKIINFSFCSNGPGKGSREDRLKFYLAPRLNFVELVAGKWSEERAIRK